MYYIYIRNGGTSWTSPPALIYRWSSVPSGAYDMMVEAEATPVKRKVVKYEPGQKTYSQDSTLFAGL